LKIEEELGFGEVKRVKLAESQEAKAIVTPYKKFDVGNGPGRTVERTVMGGEVGIILDARGRPLSLPEEEAVRRERLLKWFQALEAYPMNELEKLV